MLTDYNHLADFVEDMRMSRFVSAPGESVKVGQKGEGSLLLFRCPMEEVLALDEEPQQAIRFQSVSGNVKNMSREWRITQQVASANLSYRVRCTSRISVCRRSSAFIS